MQNIIFGHKIFYVEIFKELKIELYLKKCPRGLLNEKNLVEIYSQYFSCGDCTTYAKHLFSAMIQQHYSTALANSKDNKLKKNISFEINFQQFAITLSTIMRGTLDEKIKWLFNFYDLNKDGKISHDVGFLTSIYLQNLFIMHFLNFFFT